MAKQSDLMKYDGQTDTLKRSLALAKNSLDRDRAALAKSEAWVADCEKRLADHLANPLPLTPKQAAARAATETK